MFIDTHFHLNMIEENPSDQEKIIDECLSKGVIGGINIYTSPESFIKNLEVAEKVEKMGIMTACGWYPEYTPSEEMAKKLESVIETHNIFAIGEIGLDFYRMAKPKNDQIELFELQMEVAKKYNKPVIVHSRNAYEETINILKKFTSVRGIMHCFSGTPEVVKKCLDLGYYISFAGNITFKNAVNLQESARFVPLDRLFFETDAPFLSPAPFRGQKNYPHMVRYIYEFASNFLGISLENLSLRILQNWKDFTRK